MIYKDEPMIHERELVPIKQWWICPEKGCEGQMIYNGMTQQRQLNNYGHTCDKCKYHTYLEERKYPKIVYKEK